VAFVTVANKPCVLACVSNEVASHIVPWSEPTEEERLDVNNGILLLPLYDALYDKHLISFF
jgi:hypothetical protein